MIKIQKIESEQQAMDWFHDLMDAQELSRLQAYDETPSESPQNSSQTEISSEFILELP